MKKTKNCRCIQTLVTEITKNSNGSTKDAKWIGPDEIFLDTKGDLYTFTSFNWKIKKFLFFWKKQTKKMLHSYCPFCGKHVNSFFEPSKHKTKIIKAET